MTGRHIVLLVPEYPPETSGGGGVVYEALVEEYRKRNRVTVLAGRPGGGPTLWSGDVVRLAGPYLPQRLNFLRGTMPPSLSAITVINSVISKADIVHAHGFGHPVVDLGIFAAHRNHVPVVHTLHGHPVSQTVRGYAIKLGFAVYRYVLGERALNLSNYRTAVSSAVAETFSQRYGVDCKVIPNGVSLASEEPWPVLSDLRAAGGYLIVGVGRLEWIKGFDLAIRALLIVRRQVDARLLIIGPDFGAGKDLRELSESLGISEYVAIVGVQSRGRVTSALKSADCCLLSSHIEGFPGVPLEAMSVGTALVAADLPGLRDYAVDGLNCLQFPPGDSTAMATQLLRVLSLPDLRVKLSMAASMVAGRYRWNLVADDYERIFESLLGGDSPFDILDT